MISNSSFEEIRKKADEEILSLVPCCNTLETPKTFRIKLKWHTTQGVISVNDPKFMNWTQGTGGGGAIDLVIHLQGVDFKDAVLWLHNHFSSSFVQRFSPNKSHPVQQILKLPQKDNKKLPQVTQYLINRRCIPEELTKNGYRCKVGHSVK